MRINDASLPESGSRDGIARCRPAFLRDAAGHPGQILDAMPVLIWCTTPDGEPSYLNRRLLEYAGIGHEGVDPWGVPRSPDILRRVIHPDDYAGFDTMFRRSIATGEPLMARCRFRRGDGNCREVEVRTEPLLDEAAEVLQWQCVAVDIDDRYRATQDALRSVQDRLARSTQAASLSELSASIAHEVNQPLAAIVANSSACQRWLSSNPPNLARARKSAESVVRHANSAAEVVASIRALFRQSGHAKEPADLNHVICEVCQLMADQMARYNVRLATDLQDDLPAAILDSVQVQQVLVNLLRNGIDAIASADDDSRLLQVCSRFDGHDTLIVEVRDSGDGLKEPDRVFEPFYTTKSDGMGMGLAICRSIVEAHAGRLWAAGNEPRGTIFRFTLPTGGATVQPRAVVRTRSLAHRV